LTAFTSRIGVDPSNIDGHAAALVGSKQAVRAGDVLVSAAVFGRLKDAIVTALSGHHKAQPLSDGVPREELREQLAARAHPAVFDGAVAALAAAGILNDRDRVALATHRLALSPEEERGRAAIERAYRDGGLKPPDAAATAAAAGVSAAVADRMLKLLQRQKVLVRVDTLLFHDESLKQLKAEVAALKTSAGAGAAVRIDVATFKERFGVTRKFAIPLLEYLDRERVTRRMGETRVVL
jgi:selenocysteine-specific elongation factor